MYTFSFPRRKNVPEREYPQSIYRGARRMMHAVDEARKKIQIESLLSAVEMETFDMDYSLIQSF